MGKNVPSPGASQAQLAALNQGNRYALLASAPSMSKNLGTSNGNFGDTLRQKLFNVGVTTNLTLLITGNVTIGTAIATPSPKAPWNLIKRVRVTDYDGTDRVNLSGFQLFLLNCARNRALYGFNNSASVSAGAAAFTNPTVPTAVGNGTISFFIDVPIAYDTDNPILQLRDLRGAILSQTAVGDMYVSVDTNGSLYTNGDADSVYNGAATTTVVANGANPAGMTVWQDYLLPQAVDSSGTVPLPPIDLQTVYELQGGVKSSDNIAPNNEKLLNYPNVRSVVGAYFSYMTNGVLASGNINRVRLIANGNNALIDNSEARQLFQQRKKLYADGDIAPGTYFFDHRDRPIETVLYGNVQAGLTIATANAGNQYVEQLYESFYTKGLALPGLNQAQ